MEWIKAGGPEAQWGTSDSDMAYAFQVLDDHADALTLVGV